MDRLKSLKKQISHGTIYKIFGMSLSYFLIPLFIRYLGKRDYGLWMTIFSTISWVYTFDLGIGNGLKNKLTESLTKKNFNEANEYIATGYLVITGIAIVMLSIGTFAISHVEVTKFLNISYYTEDYIKLIVNITFILTVINFVIMLYKTFYYSIHKSEFVNLINIFIQFFIIFGIYTINYFEKISLISMAILYQGSNMLAGLFFTKYFFKRNKELVFRVKNIKKNKIKEIGKLGVNFFLIQISMLFILSVDNILIGKYIGMEEVSSYTVISKLFGGFNVLSGIVLIPIWPLFIDAYVKKDIKWIKKIFKKLNLLFLFLCLVIVVVIFLAPTIVKVWIGEELIFPKYLILFWGVYVLNTIFSRIYITFINATGDIKLQTYIYLIGGLLNIPLSIYFIKHTNLGSAGAILGTNISLSPLLFFMPFQVNRIIKKIIKK